MCFHIRSGAEYTQCRATRTRRINESANAELQHPPVVAAAAVATAAAAAAAHRVIKRGNTGSRNALVVNHKP